MFLPIVVYGHPILRKISEDITPEYPELEKFIRDLFQTMDEADGVGLQLRKSDEISVYSLSMQMLSKKWILIVKVSEKPLSMRISSNVGEMKSAATKDVSVSPASTKTSNDPTVYESAIWTSKDKNTKRSFAVLKPGSSNTNMITWKVFCLQIICLL